MNASVGYVNLIGTQMETITRRIVDPASFTCAEEYIRLGWVFSFVSSKWHTQDGVKPVSARFSYKNLLLKEPCVYCGEHKPTGRDHIVPRRAGGKDIWTNRAPACRKCDHAKGCRTMLVFICNRHNHGIASALSPVVGTSEYPKTN